MSEIDDAFDKRVRWATHCASWGSPPTEHLGNVGSEVVSQWPTDVVRRFTRDWEAARYGEAFNPSNRYRDFFDYPSAAGCTLIDFGCGLGIEALQFARAGAHVILADINPWNLVAAARVMRANFERPAELVSVSATPPYFQPVYALAIFFASGVLHHIPWARDIIRQAIELGARDFRLMLYSDKAWADHIGQPPFRDSAIEHPADLYGKFLRRMDAVGDYVDFYTREKAEREWGDLVDITEWCYLDAKGHHAGVRMRPR